MVVTAECTRTLSNGTKMPTTICHTLGLVVQIKQVQFSLETLCIFVGYFYHNGKKRSCKYSRYY